MANNNRDTVTEELQDDVTPLFQGVKDDDDDDNDDDDDDDDDNNNNAFAEGFTDRVRAIHEQFDKDQDGFLTFSELAALQRATDGTQLSEEMYLMACRALDCHPTQGISLNALRLTYAAEGTSIGTWGHSMLDIFLVFVSLQAVQITRVPCAQLPPVYQIFCMVRVL
jgi:hypothetical protein